ncbi:TrkH family potassium uptake protein [Phaeobacter sp. CNT1-3]|nr:TrkH family potassium uptake protein [Phaeobacter sp. CNT1-3]
MLDLRPVGYVIGLLVAVLGLTMLGPLVVDLWHGDPNWRSFAQSALLTFFIGGTVSLACQNGNQDGLNIQQTFILTTGVWLALPIFAALPFYYGQTQAAPVDAFFEAMSGLTTTGATVFSGLDDMAKGLLLWRGILQWLGGIGIIVVAMVFLPELRVGGMQIFRSEGFDTMGKILPRATEIASQISVIYVALTAVCALSYMFLGMNAFDAGVHALTTISTGGFSTYDASFGAFSGPLEYVASIFMILSALPFVRYVQMLNGHHSALLVDRQVYGFMLALVITVAFATAVLVLMQDREAEQSLRQVVFNVTSIMTGTGYASVDYMGWGNLLIAMFFFIGLIGGCAGSTACSIKVFRYQILFASIKSQLMKTHSPNAVVPPRFDGRKIDDDVLNSVMSFFVFFLVTMGILSVALGMTGLDFITSLSGAASALANIGPGLGDEIGPAGNFAGLNDPAKWLLSAAMLIGRLELLAVYAMLTVTFWRA